MKDSMKYTIRHYARQAINTHISIILFILTIYSSYLIPLKSSASENIQNINNTSIKANSNNEPQTYYTIEGVLKEKGTKSILSGVNIFILPHKIKSTTNNKGYFKIENIPKGKIEVIINLTGYSKFNKKTELSKDLSRLTYFLEKLSYNDFKTTVVGKQIRRDESTQQLKQREFISLPGSGGDPVKATQNLAGINRSKFGLAGVVIQGAEPEDTGYTIDGHDIPLIFHFGGLSSVLFPEATKAVNFLSAGYGPEFGQKLGGYIGLETTSPNKEKWSGFAFVDLLNTGGLIQGPINSKSEILIGGRYSYVNQVLKLMRKDDGTVASPNFYDITSIYNYRLNSKTKFKTVLIGSKDTLSILSGSDENEDFNSLNLTTEFFRIIPQLSYSINDRSEIQFSLGYGSDRIFTQVDRSSLSIKQSILSLRSEYSNKFSKLYQTYLGVDYLSNWFNVDLDFTENQVLFSIKDNSLNQGLYWRNHIKFSENSKWTFAPSIRWDHYSTLKDQLFQPRLSIKYNLSDTSEVYVSGGLYAQNPEPRETAEKFGNQNLSLQKATHYRLGLKKDFRKQDQSGFLMNASLIYKDLDKLVIPENGVDSLGNFLNFSNLGTGDIFGGEFSLLWSRKNLSSRLSYTYTDSKRKKPNEKKLPSEFDQTHSFTLLSSYKKNKWLYGLRMRYVSGNPITPITGSIFDSDEDEYLPIKGDLFSDRINPFFQVDFRVDRKIIYNNFILSIYLDIQNILNSENEEARSYSFDYSEKQIINGLPLLPTFGIKGEF